MIVKSFKIIITIFLITRQLYSQIVFSENFESYTTNGSIPVDFNYSGTWYRSDVPKQIGKYRLKGPYAKIPSKFLVVFADNTFSVTCIDISLAIGSIYQLKFDHTWQLQVLSKLFVHWNNNLIFSFASYTNYIQGQYILQQINLTTTINTINTFCFSGYNSMNGSRLGPCIDNIVITLLSTANSTNQTNTSNNSINITNNTVINNTVINNTNNTNNIIINDTDSSNITNNTNTNNTNTTNTSANEVNNRAVVQIQVSLQQKLHYINIDWAKSFMFGLNKILKFMGFFGFSYLISNLLNFWNIFVLYYFLPYEYFLDPYRAELQFLCQISLHIPGIYKFSSLTSNTSILKNTKKHNGMAIILLAWSNIPSSTQQLPILFHAVIFIIYIWSLIGGFKFPYLEMFCYEVLNNIPGMIMPVAVMLSINSAISFSTWQQKINNTCAFLAFPMCFVAIIFPFLYQYKPFTQTPPAKRNIQQTIFIQQQHQPIQQTDKEKAKKVKFRQSNQIPQKTKKQKQQQEYKNKLNHYKNQKRYYEYKFWKRIIQIFQQCLFFTVPFLVGLQDTAIFLIVNLIPLLILLILTIRKRHLIKQFDFKQFWFGLAIRVVFLTIHLLFIVLYLQDRQIIKLNQTQAGYINFFVIFGIILGALIQIVHSFVNLVQLIFQVIKRLRLRMRQNKIANSDLQQQMKNSNLVLHCGHNRKQTQSYLNPANTIDNNLKNTRTTIQAIQIIPRN